MEVKVVELNRDITWVSDKDVEDRIDSQYYRREFVINNFKLNKLKSERLSNIIYEGDYGILPNSEDYCEQGINFVRGTDLRDLSINNEGLIKVPENYYSKKYALRQGDILMLIKGATIDAEWSVSVVPNIDYKAIYNGSIFRIRLKEEYNPYYIAAYMSTKYFLLQKKRAISNTGIFYNDKNSIEKFLIPITSPEIQKYIGDKVRKAEELREEAKKVEFSIKEIMNEIVSIEMSKSMMWNLNPIYISDRLDCKYNYKYFYELKEKFVKKGLNVVEFGSLIEKKMSEPQTDSSDFIQSGIPVLRITDIQEDSLNFESCARISEEVYEKLKEFQLTPNDIIFGLSGTVGRAIVVPNEIPDKVITNRRVAKVTLKDPKLAHYIVSFLNSECGVAQLLREATGGVQKNLRLEDITKIKIPLPENKYIDSIESKCKEKVKLLDQSKKLIIEAKKDVEDLIEGNFDMSKLNQS